MSIITQGKTSYFSDYPSSSSVPAHSQRLVSVQSMLRQTGRYRTLERDLMELQERKLFEYFLVVALHKTKAGVPYLPEVTQQFPLKVQTFFPQKQNKSDLPGLEDVHVTLKRSVNRFSKLTHLWFFFLISWNEALSLCAKLKTSWKSFRNSVFLTLKTGHLWTISPGIESTWFTAVITLLEAHLLLFPYLCCLGINCSLFWTKSNLLFLVRLSRSS